MVDILHGDRASELSPRPFSRRTRDQLHPADRCPAGRAYLPDGIDNLQQVHRTEDFAAEADAEKQVQRPKEINVGVDATGRFALNKQVFTFTTVAALAQALRDAAGGATDPVIIINADAAAKHQDVVHVMEAARAAQYANITFATQSPGNKARPRCSRNPAHLPSCPALLEKTWWARQPTTLARLLKPLSWLYGLVVRIGADLYRRGVFRRSHPGVAVVVVGNVVVGGAGKTPVVQAIVRCLQKAGYRPGIISRGYPVSPRKRRAP